MKNLGQLMKQAQEMQTRMAELQAKLAEAEVTGQSGGGLVEVTLNGKFDVRRIRIDTSIAKPDDVEVLEDLIVAAFKDAKAKAEAQVQEEMKKLTGGLGLPGGFNLPF
jgi:DNA-binding YbaB/EbfC family protein